MAAVEQLLLRSLVEMGAGQGLVAADVLTYLEKITVNPECFAALNYLIYREVGRSQGRYRSGGWHRGRVGCSGRHLEDTPDDGITGLYFLQCNW